MRFPVSVALALVLAACGSSRAAERAPGAGPRDGASGTATESSGGAPPDALAACGISRVAIVEPSAGLLETLAPYRERPPSSPRMQGLLLPSRSRWGLQAAWARVTTPLILSASHDVYVFTTADAAPWALYFESTGEGTNFLRGWNVPLADGTRGTYDAAMFRPSTPNRHGLSREAHIVDVAVNGGRGAGPGIHFVATEVRVLDRTAALPLDPVAALDDARACFDAFRASTTGELAEALARAGDAHASGPSLGPESEHAYEAFTPTFDPVRRVLRVTFVERVVRQSVRTEVRRIVHDCPPGAPCMPPRDQTFSTIHGYGVDRALLLELDARGVRLRSEAHGPVAVDPRVLERAGVLRGQ